MKDILDHGFLRPADRGYFIQIQLRSLVLNFDDNNNYIVSEGSRLKIELDSTKALNINQVALFVCPIGMNQKSKEPRSTAKPSPRCITPKIKQ